MKRWKKLVGLALAVAMLMGLASPVLADDGDTSKKVNITVNRDESYPHHTEVKDEESKVEDDASGNREFTWYRVFDATYPENKEENSQDHKNTFTQTPDGSPVAYTLDAKVDKVRDDDPWVSVLGTWDKSKREFTKADEQRWFVLELSADESKYNVTLDDDILQQYLNDNKTEGDMAKDAAKWLFAQIENAKTPNQGLAKKYSDSNKNKTWGIMEPIGFNSDQHATEWGATVDKGYYLIESSAGQNLIAATTDMTVYEKNTYPRIDKMQTDDPDDPDDPDDSVKPYTNDAVSVRIGDTIDYQIAVFVPSDTSQNIIIEDTMSLGLSKKIDEATQKFKVTARVVKSENGDPDFTYEKNRPAETTECAIETEKDKDGNEDSQKWSATIFDPTSYNNTNQDNQDNENKPISVLGNYVVFTYSAVINEQAITDLPRPNGEEDTSRRNKVVLNYDYDETHKIYRYTMEDEVPFKIYAGGAVKYNSSTAIVREDQLEGKNGQEVEYLSGAQFKLQEAVKPAEGETPASDAWKDVAVKKITEHDANVEDYYIPDDKNPTESEIIISEKDDVDPKKGTKGHIVIRGLDNPDEKLYRLIETKAPDGYNMLGQPSYLSLEQDSVKNVTIKAWNGTDQDKPKDTLFLEAKGVAKIANSKGMILPSTGGIGTTIFYILGSVLVIGAGAFMIIRKRRG